MFKVCSRHMRIVPSAGFSIDPVVDEEIQERALGLLERSRPLSGPHTQHTLFTNRNDDTEKRHAASRHGEGQECLAGPGGDE